MGYLFSRPDAICHCVAFHLVSFVILHHLHIFSVLRHLNKKMSAAPETAPQPMETEVIPVAGSAPNQEMEKDTVDDTLVEEKNKADSIKELKIAKVVLRLDDGTMARFKDDTKSVELLDPQAAWKAGTLKEEHLLRIQSLLCEVHAKLPEEGPLKSVSLLSSKRSIDTVLEVGQINSAKKAKPTFGNHVSSKSTIFFGWYRNNFPSLLWVISITFYFVY